MYSTKLRDRELLVHKLESHLAVFDLLPKKRENLGIKHHEVEGVASPKTHTDPLTLDYKVVTPFILRNWDDIEDLRRLWCRPHIREDIDEMCRASPRESEHILEARQREVEVVIRQNAWKSPWQIPITDVDGLELSTAYAQENKNEIESNLNGLAELTNPSHLHHPLQGSRVLSQH